MKRSIHPALMSILFSIISLYGFSQAENDVRSYTTAIGGRLGFLGRHQTVSDIDFAAISYKRFVTAKSAAEINLGWGVRNSYTQSAHHFSLSANYQLHFPIGRTGLRPFIGGGGAAIYAISNQIRYGTNVGQFFPAFYPILGIDYKWRSNFNMAVDVRPMTRLLGKRTKQFGDNTDFAPYAGLSFRRTF